MKRFVDSRATRGSTREDRTVDPAALRAYAASLLTFKADAGFKKSFDGMIGDINISGELFDVSSGCARVPAQGESTLSLIHI